MQNKKLQTVLFTIFFIIALLLIIFGSEQMIEIYSKDQSATKKITESEMIEESTYTGVQRKDDGNLVSRFWEIEKAPEKVEGQESTPVVKEEPKTEDKNSDKKACPT